MRKGIISLLIIAILSLCMLNVAVASTIRLMSTDHDGRSTSVTAHQPTTLIIIAPIRANVNVSLSINGTLTVGGKGIAGATVHIQRGTLQLATGRPYGTVRLMVKASFPRLCSCTSQGLHLQGRLRRRQSVRI